MNSAMALALIFIAALLTSMWQLSATMATSGPYDNNIELVYPCADQGTNEGEFDLHVYRTQDRNNRKFLYRGSITWPEEADNIQVGLVLLKKGSTDYELFYNHIPSSMCRDAHLLWELVESLCKSIGVSATCPLPPGKYIIEDWDISIQKHVFPMMQYGHYKANISLSSDNKVFLCMEMLFEIAPKKLPTSSLTA